LGLFKITGENGIAAGVRRITAVTGNGFLKLFNQYEALLNRAAETLKCSLSDLPAKLEAQSGALKEAQKEIEKLSAKIASGKADEILNTATKIGDLRVACAVFDKTGADELKKMADSLRDKNDDIVLLLAAKSSDKITFVAAASKKAVAAGVHAGNLVRRVAELTGGKGGGKPDMAMAGGKDISRLTEATESVNGIVKEMLGV
ncbi:MAG: alanine--tRNA ligase, partial [Clostridia bacterium]|nr:alanine--tRNA ligase [Clostridia bacterium]